MQIKELQSNCLTSSSAGNIGIDIKEKSCQVQGDQLLVISWQWYLQEHLQSNCLTGQGQGPYANQRGMVKLFDLSWQYRDIDIKEKQIVLSDSLYSQLDSIDWPNEEVKAFQGSGTPLQSVLRAATAVKILTENFIL